MEACVIGGGFSGIISAKILLDHGLVPFIICKSPAAGGLWNGYPNEVGTWESMVSNGSKYMFTFSDYLWNEEDPEFVTPQQVRNYLNGYIQKHSLHEYFHFNCTVIEVSRNVDSYNVKWSFGGEITERVFRYVVIAVGRFHILNNPLLNQELFNGKIILSSDYREPSVFTGKKVVVVGRSFSGSGISLDALRTTESVTQVYTRPYLILKKTLGGMPFDLHLNSLNSMSSAVEFTQTTESSIKLSKFIMSTFGNPSRVLPEWELPEPPMEFYRPCLDPDEYLEAISSKRIAAVRGTAQGFYSNGLVLSDGRQVEADVVVLCTGYLTDFRFFSEEIKNILEYRENDGFLPVTLYRSIIHPSLPGMSFVGMVSGVHPGRYELSAEVGIRQMLGTISLTQEELMEGVMLERYTREVYKDSYLSYSIHGYINELLRILNVEINYELIKNDLEFSKGMIVPQMFFLERPGQVELTKQVIAEIKIKYNHRQFN